MCDSCTNTIDTVARELEVPRSVVAAVYVESSSPRHEKSSRFRVVRDTAAALGYSVHLTGFVYYAILFHISRETSSKFVPFIVNDPSMS